MTQRVIEINEDELGVLMLLAGTESYKDTLNLALSYLDWILKRRNAGCVIVAINEDDKTYSEPLFDDGETT